MDGLFDHLGMVARLPYAVSTKNVESDDISFHEIVVKGPEQF